LYCQEVVLHLPANVFIRGQKIKELPPKEKIKIYNLIFAFPAELMMWDDDTNKLISCFEKLRKKMGHDLEKGVEPCPVTVTFDEVSPFVLFDYMKKAQGLHAFLCENNFFCPPKLPQSAALAPALSTLSANVPTGYPKFFPAEVQPAVPALLEESVQPAPKPLEKQTLSAAAKPWTPPVSQARNQV
jgi:hypothetical protein